ncbi:MAG TPA: hypothetical protein VJ739_08650, partial [Gemmataceae bacterium]|nr:hypothetical protein [Gemmataceae bacterium]
MRPVLLLGVLLLLPTALVLAPAAPAPTPPPKEVSKQNPLVEQLHRSVRFNGWEADPKMTLQEGLDALTKLAEPYDLRFDVNEAAFRAEMVEDVLSKPVAERAIPAMREVRLGQLLHKVLERIPSTSGTVYVIRHDHIEITTGAAVRNEFWGPNYPGPYLPLIHATFDRRPLDEAVADLAGESGWNVVADAGLGEKVRTPVTARLFNVPVDTAVRLLADMAGLKTFAVDNVLYVTTPEKAAAMEKREKERMEERMMSG